MLRSNEALFANPYLAFVVKLTNILSFKFRRINCSNFLFLIKTLLWMREERIVGYQTSSAITTRVRARATTVEVEIAGYLPPIIS